MHAAFFRFGKYSAIGVFTFLCDLGMLYAAVSWFGIAYYIATPVTFLIAVSGNYVLSRQMVFKGTTRSLHGGYVYFIVAALLGAGVTTGLVAVLVSFVGFYFVAARVAVAGVIGVGNYLFNLYFSFKVAGKHLSVMEI